MFFRKNKNKCNIPKTCKIKLFNKTYTISVIIEGNVVDDDCMNLYKHFITVTEQIETKIKEYVEKNYFKLLKDYYVDFSDDYPLLSQERKEHMSVIKDYENKEKEAIDIVLKNIRPTYFSVLEKEKSYLFFFLNDIDEDGFDVVINPNFLVVPHDEFE